MQIKNPALEMLMLKTRSLRLIGQMASVANKIDQHSGRSADSEGKAASAVVSAFAGEMIQRFDLLENPFKTLASKPKVRVPARTSE
jgi:hypothetical protein